MIVHDWSMETQLYKTIPTPSTILWYANTRGKKVVTYTVHQTLPNTKHGVDSTAKANTGNAAATSSSPNTNDYTINQYSWAPSVLS